MFLDFLCDFFYVLTHINVLKNIANSCNILIYMVIGQIVIELSDNTHRNIYFYNKFAEILLIIPI